MVICKSLMERVTVFMLAVLTAAMLVAPLAGCSDTSEGALQPGFASAVADGLPAENDDDTLANASEPDDPEKLDEHVEPEGQEAVVPDGGGTPEAQDPNAGKTWHVPWDEQVLVSAAWTEEVYHPATYTTVHHPKSGHHGSRCNQCGMEITGQIHQHYDARWPNCWSYTNMYWFVDSPAWDEQVVASAAWTEYISHPAVYRTVHHDGYWE